jgi:hypothetical protein
MTRCPRLLSTLLLAIVVLMCGGGGGCTTSGGRTDRSAAWRADRPLGDVLVVVPSFRGVDGEARPEKDAKIRAAVHEALSKHPGAARVIDGTSVVAGNGERRGGPVSEAEAVEAARKVNAKTVCLVTVGQFGGRYLATALPPGWDARTTVQYALRILDVQSGELLLDSVRERTTGGYLAIMSATYPADLTADMTGVLTETR